MATSCRRKLHGAKKSAMRRQKWDLKRQLREEMRRADKILRTEMGCPTTSGIPSPPKLFRARLREEDRKNQIKVYHGTISAGELIIVDFARELEIQVCDVGIVT